MRWEFKTRPHANGFYKFHKRHKPTWLRGQPGHRRGIGRCLRSLALTHASVGTRGAPLVARKSPGSTVPTPMQQQLNLGSPLASFPLRPSLSLVCLAGLCFN